MRIRLAFVGWPWLLLLALPLAVRAANNPIAPGIRPFLEKHCLECHGSQKPQGKLRLDNLAVDFSNREVARVWIEVMDRLNLGEMPPGKAAARHRAGAGGDALDRRGMPNAQRQATGNHGRTLLRRLNRTEYTDTIRDLLGMTFLPGESPLDFLPPDGRLEGFDKTARRS